jgi:hypothetical protein
LRSPKRVKWITGGGGLASAIALAVLYFWLAPEMSQPPAAQSQERDQVRQERAAADQRPVATPRLHKHYSSADVGQLTQALRSTYGILNNKALPLLVDVNRFSRDWLTTLSTHGPNPVIEELATLQAAAHDLSERISDIERDNEYYRDEVRYVVNAPGGEFAGSVEYGAKNLASALRGVTGSPNDSTFALLTPSQQAFDNAREQLSRRIDQAKQRIQELRASMDALQ